mmetsp:Transcript_3240/g.5192  ORF Transcript_3240/g.5192 Transcript_3240/m.5192 type:complete len:228 (+) Transcript_3240:505-1188(+)
MRPVGVDGPLVVLRDKRLPAVCFCRVLILRRSTDETRRRSELLWLLLLVRVLPLRLTRRRAWSSLSSPSASPIDVVLLRLTVWRRLSRPVVPPPPLLLRGDTMRTCLFVVLSPLSPFFSADVVDLTLSDAERESCGRPASKLRLDERCSRFNESPDLCERDSRFNEAVTDDDDDDDTSASDDDADGGAGALAPGRAIRFTESLANEPLLVRGAAAAVFERGNGSPAL